MKVALNSDWTEFLKLLIDHGVRFLLVGGHAVAAHGEARLTEDLDVFVEATAVNAGRLRNALVAFGFGTIAPTEATLAQPDKVFMLGRKPWRIDILTSIDGVSFRRAWAGRKEIEFVTKPLFVIGRAALLANKRASGRPKDLADVALIEATSGARPRSRGKKKT